MRYSLQLLALLIKKWFGYNTKKTYTNTGIKVISADIQVLDLICCREGAPSLLNSTLMACNFIAETRIIDNPSNWSPCTFYFHSTYFCELQLLHVKDLVIVYHQSFKGLNFSGTSLFPLLLNQYLVIKNSFMDVGYLFSTIYKYNCTRVLNVKLFSNLAAFHEFI